MKSNREMRLDNFIMLTVLGAQAAAKQVDDIKKLYVRDMETHGEGDTLEVIRMMNIEDVDSIVREFSEVSKRIEEIRDFFHSARRV